MFFSIGVCAFAWPPADSQARAEPVETSISRRVIGSTRVKPAIGLGEAYLKRIGVWCGGWEWVTDPQVSRPRVSLPSSAHRAPAIQTNETNPPAIATHPQRLLPGSIHHMITPEAIQTTNATQTTSIVTPQTVFQNESSS